MRNNSKLRASRGNYETARTLLRLAVFLQGSPKGRTIKEIQAHLTCSRATANRWLDALRETPELRPRPLKPQEGDNPTQYRWILDKRHLPVTVSPEPSDIAVLEKVIGELASKRQRSQLSHLKTKLEAIANEQRREVKEVSAEDRLVYRGILVRTGFRFEIDERWTMEIEGAIQRRHRILLTIESHALDGADQTKLVLPIGIQVGLKTQLIAADATLKVKICAYDFDTIKQIRETKDGYSLERLPSIEEYSKQSYGSLRFGRPEDVALEFSGAAARSAQRYRFHSEQIIEEDFNEGICIKRTIRFRATGLYELGIDLLRFGENVRVVTPDKLAIFHKNLIKRLQFISHLTNIISD